jgi:Rps23 Pro-64 3,4-dihydroxylase Tpa1-like proline 4-hydroxylase
MIIADSPITARSAPFPHAVAYRLLASSFAEQVLQWLEREAAWRLRVESFYEQYELNLHQAGLPAHLRDLVAGETIDLLADRMLAPLTQDGLVLMEANAHKLLPGQTVKIHNDYIDGAETHRVLIQLNRDWTDENGGLLMLFSGPNATEVARIIRPINCSAMAFEISPTSFHAVSTILAGARHTLVYSFKRAA